MQKTKKKKKKPSLSEIETNTSSRKINLFTASSYVWSWNGAESYDK
jgi:hypothetical protein